jgi:heat-inducible transcriptional repressor
MDNSLLASNSRARDIFKSLVESYLENGEPVGSRHLAKKLTLNLSAASIRNVMQDLEETGLLFSPHTSAGRMPTDLGLRFFVDGLMEFGSLSKSDKSDIEGIAAARAKSPDEMLVDASTMLSGLSRGAGVVLTTRQNARLKHIEFVRIEPLKALVVMVTDDGAVENRLIALPLGLPAFALNEASNFLNAHIVGKTLEEARLGLKALITSKAHEVDRLTQTLIETGLAFKSGGGRQLIVTGQSNLLGDLKALEDLERVRLLLADLESKEEVMGLLSKAEDAEGVRIYIGSENKLFSLSGSSLIVAPYHDEKHKIIGVLGVIGPTRLNYAKIVPVVDYTAKVISSLFRA